ncbi:uncharacterized protein LOC115657755 isoform X2 [Gopherus evgoodei]|uniref:uncharacterized protein LOC115657755 isoform X2 n=1 Tax=Gopherus evgoodei TaxID=1825980 RepID=UPI0011CF6CC3|nr:uncharacterized protein LOC115657755 isoform X2 [Gopherus evgoodei]
MGQGLQTADSSLRVKSWTRRLSWRTRWDRQTGSSGTVASQDLFLTQAGLSQQSVSDAPDAGEGSSDVVFRGTHYMPAECLCQCWAKLRAQFQGGGFPHLKVLHPLLVIPDLPNDAIPPRSACFPSPKATVHHVQQLSECQK